MRRHFVSTIFVGILLALVTFTTQAEPLEISQKIWGVTRLPGENSSISPVRKIASGTPQDFKLMIDCDYYKGRYQSDETSLRISTLKKTASDCDAESKNDALFLNALLAVDSYELTNESLKLLNAKGELIVQLEPTTTFDSPASKAKAGKKDRKSKKTKTDKKVTKTKAIKGNATKPKASVKTSATVKKSKAE